MKRRIVTWLFAATWQYTEYDLAMALELANLIEVDGSAIIVDDDCDLDNDGRGLVSSWLRAEVISALRGER